MNDEIRTQGTEVEAKPAVESSTPAAVDNQSKGTESTPTETTSERLPFNKDPEVQKYIDRQIEKRAATREKQMQDEYVKRLEEVNQRRADSGKPPVQQIPKEQEDALMELAEKLFSNPAVREKYKLGREDLETQVQSLKQERERESFESELDSVLSKYSSEYGYDKGELDDQIRDFIANDPWFADKPYSKGAAEKAVKLYFSDKSKELAEKSVALKLIKEQKEKKSNSTESSSSKGSKSSVKDKSLKDFLDRRTQEEGGISFD